MACIFPREIHLELLSKATYEAESGPYRLGAMARGGSSESGLSLATPMEAAVRASGITKQERRKRQSLEGVERHML